MGSIHAPALHILVMRAADGTPLLDAGVEKIRIDGAFEDECPLHETTDEDGIATFGDPPSGTFQILAHATGFLSGAATISLEPLREDPKGFTLALIEGEEGVAVETAGGRHVVTFFLREEATLNGRVIDDEGKPCEGLDVSILDGIPPLARVTCYGHRS